MKIHTLHLLAFTKYFSNELLGQPGLDIGCFHWFSDISLMTNQSLFLHLKIHAIMCHAVISHAWKVTYVNKQMERAMQSRSRGGGGWGPAAAVGPSWICEGMLMLAMVCHAFVPFCLSDPFFFLSWPPSPPSTNYIFLLFSSSPTQLWLF